MKLNLFPLQSFRARLTLFSLAIFVGSIWSLAYFISTTLGNDTERLLGETQFSKVSIVAEDIDQKLNTRFQALERTAQKVTAAQLSDPKALQASLEDRPAVDVLFNGGFYVADFNGKVIADFPLSTGRLGLNYSGRDYIENALKGINNVSKPFFGATLGAPIFVMIVPIRDAQGKVVAALAGVINLGKPNFLNKIATVREGKTGGYLLVAPQYRLVITATDKTRIMEPLPAKGVLPLIDRFIEGYEGTGVTLNPRGVEVLTSAKRIPTAGWYLVASLPTEEVYAPIRAMQRRVLVISIFLTVFAGFLTWWMLRRQLDPVLKIAKILATLSNATGPLQPLPIVRKDEIGDLIGGFNQLMGTLAESEERFKLLFTSIDQGMALHEIIVDATGKPVDYVFIDINGSYTRLLGVTREMCIGKRITEVMPKVEQYWIDLFGKVALTGKPSYYENYLETTGKYYSTYSFSPKKNQFAVLVNDISERKIAEEKKRISEMRYRDLLANLETGVVIHAPDTSITMNNPRASELLGLSDDQLKGKEAIDPAWTFLDEGKNPLPLEMYPVNRILSSKQAIKNKLLGIYQPGKTELIWLIVNGFPSLNNAGEISEIVISFFDVTERVLAENALRKIQQGFEFAVQGAQLGVWDLNPQTGAVIYSNLWAQMMGYSPEEVEPNIDFFMQHIHPDDLASVKERLADHLEGRKSSYESEHRFRTKSGRYLWVMDRGKIVESDQEGHPIRVTGIIADITKLKDTEKFLLLTRLSVESASDAFYWIKPDGHFVNVNEAACRMLGYTREELLQLSVSDLDENYRGESWSNHYSQVKSFGSVNIETVHRAKNGELIPVEIAANYIQFEGEEYNCAFVRDISDRKLAEEKLRESEKKQSEILEQRVRDRTIQMEAANKELEAFAYSVSHDLRAPLRGIDGWSLALSEDYRDKLDEKAINYLDRVRSETQRMGRLIDDVLKLSLLSRAWMKPQSLNLSAMAQTVTERLQGLFATREVHVQIQPGLSANGDFSLVEIGLTNLFENAFKFTEGVPVAKVEFGQEPVDGVLAFFVRDNGAGFDMAYASKLFGAFQRMHTQAEFAGTGIGLATVQRVINRHGGRVWVDTKPGMGATFYFTLGGDYDIQSNYAGGRQPKRH